MAITFKELTEATGKRVRYTFEEDGRTVYGTVLNTKHTKKVMVQWEDEHTPTEYGIDDNLPDLNHMDIVGNAPKTLTRRRITRAVEDAILLGTDYGRNKFDTATALAKKDELLKTLLG